MPTKPFQGLKLYSIIERIVYIAIRAEMPTKPFQGLKLDSILWTAEPHHAEMPTKPFQGLKQALLVISTNRTPPLKCPLSPFRD